MVFFAWTASLFLLSLRLYFERRCIFFIKTIVHLLSMFKKSLLYIIVLFACFFNRLAAQEEFIEPPSKFLTKVYFTQLTGGVILLQGQLMGFSDTLNFILDTGSGGISLDSSTASYMKLNPIPTNRTIRGIAGIRTVSFVN